MTFTSPIFLFLFIPLALTGYYLIRHNLRNLFLLAASLTFYAFGEPRFVALLALSILMSYLFGRLIDRVKEHLVGKRLVLLLSLIWNFGLLFYFKYLIFTLKTVSAITNVQFALPEIALPLGISFFTFRTVSYILDIYCESVPVQKNIVDVALYVSFFPQVTMGPIMKYADFHTQLRDRKFDLDNCAEGVKRIILGLCKKLILSNGIAVMVDQAFSTGDSERSVLLAWMGIIGYLLQLYYDFSGYSDMAIGLGSLFGFQTKENFNFPYLSKSVAEFWARWHITLGTWMKDYLYVPAFRALNRKKVPLLDKTISVQMADYIALLAVWLFAGVWHGAAWHFIIYGLYNYFFILLERIKDNYLKQRRKRLKLKKQPETKLQAALAHIYFVIVIIFGQLLFRIPSGGAYFLYIKSMFGMMGNPLSSGFAQLMLMDNLLIFFLGILFCFPAAKMVKQWMQTYVITNRIYKVVTPILYLVLFLVAISYMLLSSYNPFLYLNF